MLTEDFGQPESVAVLRPLASGLDLMLSSEDHFRAAERRQERGIDPEGAQQELHRARRLNDAARTTVDDVLLPQVSRLGDRLAADGPIDDEPYVVLFDQLAREQVADLGLSARSGRWRGRPPPEPRAWTARRERRR